MAEKLPLALRKVYEVNENTGGIPKLIEIFVALLHSRRCFNRSQESICDGTGKSYRIANQCYLPQCSNFRALYAHMLQCTDGEKCDNARCILAQNFFEHFDQCYEYKCPVCEPIKDIFLNNDRLSLKNRNNIHAWQHSISFKTRQDMCLKLLYSLTGYTNERTPDFKPKGVPEPLLDSVIYDIRKIEERYFEYSRSMQEYSYFCTLHMFKLRLTRQRAFSHHLMKNTLGVPIYTLNVRHTMLRMWYLIDGHKDSHWFRVSVPKDPVVAPNYYDIVSEPMDLTTMRGKIDNNKYHCLRAFFEDLWLIFENARHYNTDESDVHIATLEMLKHIDPVAEKILTQEGYCCGKRRSYAPAVIFCHSASNCTIRPREYYWFYDVPRRDTKTGKPITSLRYRFCDNCYNQAKMSKLGVLEAASELAVPPGSPPVVIPYQTLVMINNNRPRREPLVTCLSCNRLSHNVCVSYSPVMYPCGFLCSLCTTKLTTYKITVNGFVSRLPVSNISAYIEERVNNFINSELGRNSNTSYDDGRILVRMLCNAPHEVEVKPRILSHYPSMPKRIPYRSKAIFAFQVVDGKEICFFGMHVQEYGNVPGPNRNRVYISYLDSVHYFTPKVLRTRVYYMIILSYLENCRQRGFEYAHIWACPPSTGDDYIFNGHPQEQKMPKTKQLQEWYQKMAAFGMERGMIVECKHLSEYGMQHNINSIVEFPYFDGDFWVNHIEEIIEDCEKRELKQQQQMVKDLERLEKQSTPVTDLFPTIHAEFPYRKNSKSRPRTSSVSCAKRRCLSTRQLNLKEIIEERFMAAVRKNRDNFFCFTLVASKKENYFMNVFFMDMDPLLPSELMDGRDSFLAKCRENSWVFSSLRHTAYSTMQMCYALMNQAPMEVHYTCNYCGNAPTLHCLVCDDFDVCDRCDHNHEHKLELLATLHTLEFSSKKKQNFLRRMLSPQPSR